MLSVGRVHDDGWFEFILLSGKSVARRGAVSVQLEVFALEETDHLHFKFVDPLAERLHRRFCLEQQL